jgi:tRNA1Val (adenine37-N6)-methyltransferase
LRITSEEFRFKHFSVYQPEGVFKIGTDAVLLGAWTCLNNPKHILDIGCGTGVIGLMLAQRFPEACITAIDPYPLHAKTTQFNYESSPFNNRFNVFNTEIQKFIELKIHQNAYDCIVCNPPYFTNALKSKTFINRLSRHQDNLSLNDLFKAVHYLLDTTGIFSLILPFNQYRDILHLAKTYNLMLNRSCTIFSTVKSTAPKRVLMAFSKCDWGEAQKDVIYIQEVEHRAYTKHYKTLTQDFYLNF